MADRPTETTTPSDPREPRAVRIANCSGFFGDRVSAAREQVDGGPIDVLTGDWLAELTMLILVRQRLKRGPGSGYARTFLTQMRDVLGTCLDRGIRVVSNAGGLDPQGCADALREIADELGLSPRIAVVTGDDLTTRPELITEAVNLSTGEKLADLGLVPVTANAYLGAFGIAAALEAGADVVITGRVTDAALAVGPAAWWHGWTPDDLDPLAGAVVAAHVIECGAQATGGNYAFFTEIGDMTHLGFPIAEIDAAGSSAITKHPGTGGAVSVGTVTAQLLYEVDSPAYLGPDVVARFDTIRLSDAGPDRVRIHPVAGDPPPDTLKVALTTLGGFRNTVGVVITGLDADAKADLVQRQLAPLLAMFAHAQADRVPFGPERVELRITAVDPDQAKVGRAFSNAVIELTLASYAGFYPTAPPADARPYSIYWPTTVPAGEVEQVVSLDGTEITRVPALSPLARPAAAWPTSADSPGDSGATDVGSTTKAPLGLIAGARSGDKGGDANIGLWVRTDEAVGWLLDLVTPERVRTWIPEAADKHVDVYPLPNLRAVNIVVRGHLGRGVADGVGLDPQAKGLGEWVRAQEVDVPTSLLVQGTP
ncbi:MAG: acyclic terpene utilization AtuA family protein [Jiangellales bacterium]